MKKAINKCMQCNHTWSDYPGSGAQIKPKKRENSIGQTWYEPACPKCLSDYWEWTNYGIT